MTTAVLITSVARPGLLTQCIESWCDVLPRSEYSLLIAEQGACAEASHASLAAWGGHWEHFTLPYDAGISASRNYLVGKALKIGCDRVLLAADSIHGKGFDSTLAAKIGGFLDVSTPLVGGRLSGREDYTAGLGLDKEGFFLYNQPQKILNKDLRITECGICCNFFLALTEVLANVRWDPELKTNEHEDFFWRYGAAGFTAGHCEDLQASYVKEFTPEYEQLRSRVNGSGPEVLRRKYGITKWLRRA